MKISELIAKLEEVKARHGDLHCITYDGLDPADPAGVIDVEIDRDDYSWISHIGPYAFIRA